MSIVSISMLLNSDSTLSAMEVKRAGVADISHLSEHMSKEAISYLLGDGKMYQTDIYRSQNDKNKFEVEHDLKTGTPPRPAAHSFSDTTAVQVLKTTFNLVNDPSNKFFSLLVADHQNKPLVNYLDEKVNKPASDFNGAKNAFLEKLKDICAAHNVDYQTITQPTTDVESPKAAAQNAAEKGKPGK